METYPEPRPRSHRNSRVRFSFQQDEPLVPSIGDMGIVGSTSEADESPTPDEQHPITIHWMGETESTQPVPLHRPHAKRKSKMYTLGVYLGFLQGFHKYEVKFNASANNLPSSLAKAIQAMSESNGVKSFFDIKKEPLYSRLIETSWTMDDPANPQIGFFLEIKTMGDHSFEDKFSIGPNFESEEDDFSTLITVKLYAQVLGKGMGTPTLKDGIRCIHQSSHDEDDGTSSDMSTEDQETSANLAAKFTNLSVEKSS